MLVLSRKCGQTVCIGQDITITFLRVRGQVTKIGIDAPSLVRILRGELCGGRVRPSQFVAQPGAIPLPLRLTADLQPLIGMGRHQG